MTRFTVLALAVLLYSCSSVPEHPSHPIATPPPPQVGQVPPPHPAHPIEQPWWDVSNTVGTSNHIKDVWLTTWCGDSPNWCGTLGNVMPPHPEQQIAQ
jgi:hypothetical protein